MGGFACERPEAPRPGVRGITGVAVYAPLVEVKSMGGMFPEGHERAVGVIFGQASWSHIASCTRTARYSRKSGQFAFVNIVMP